jgi:uncharacterized protein
MSNSKIVPQPPPEGALAPTHAAPRPLNTFFRGPNGIRAGWRAAIFVALASAIALFLSLLIALVLVARYGIEGARAAAQITQINPFGLGLTELMVFLLPATGASLIMSQLEHRPWGVYGLPPRSAFRGDFWIGGFAGFLSISTCLLAIFMLHGFHLTGLAIHGTTVVSAIAAWSMAFVIVGLAEEFSFRGYLQYTLTTGIGFWPSAILLSLLFALAHRGNPGESNFGLLSVVLFGIVFCFVLRRTGNLWWAVGFHAGWDWGQTFFYGVPDSGIAPYHNLFNSTLSGPRWLTGGPVGPEASIFTPIVLVLFAFVFSRAYRGNKCQPSVPASQTSAIPGMN